MTEDVVAAVKLPRKLEVRIREVFEAVLPQAHVLEVAKRLIVRFDPVRRAKRHHQEDARHIGEKGAENQGVYQEKNTNTNIEIKIRDPLIGSRMRRQYATTTHMRKWFTVLHISNNNHTQTVSQIKVCPLSHSGTREQIVYTSTHWTPSGTRSSR